MTTTLPALVRDQQRSNQLREALRVSGQWQGSMTTHREVASGRPCLTAVLTPRFGTFSVPEMQRITEGLQYALNQRFSAGVFEVQHALHTPQTGAAIGESRSVFFVTYADRDTDESICYRELKILKDQLIGDEAHRKIYGTPAADSFEVSLMQFFQRSTEGLRHLQ